MGEQIRHDAEQMFDVDSKWCVPCTCGQRSTAPSPSGATAKHRKHAEAAARQGARAEKANTTPARAKSCGCGCGEPLATRAAGLFRSGHDARFKSVLTVAHAAGDTVRHPLTGEPTPAMEVAEWLDERRGVGTFWRDKVTAGHKPQPTRTPRPATVALTEEDRVARSHARVDAIMNYNRERQARRATPGDLGMVTMRDGQKYGAQVIRQESADALSIRITDGPKINTECVIPDARFKRAAKHTEVNV